MVQIAYSILSHYPSLINNECINIGIIFHNVSDNKFKFEYTHNFKRISSFNDELDINFLRIQLSEIKKEVEGSLVNYGPNYNISSFTRFYVNELKFSEVSYVNYDDFDDFIIETKKLYLRFDFDKKDRFSHQEELNLIKKLLKNKNNTTINQKINGYFNEKLTFDFVKGDYAFKFFTFKEKNQAHLINTVKSWAYNAIKLKDKYKFIFVTDLDLCELNDNYKIVLEILKSENTKILNYNQLIPFVDNIKLEKAQ